MSETKHTPVPTSLERSSLDFCQNDGAKPFCGYYEGDEDRVRVGTIDAQATFKRGTGHKSVCDRREALIDEVIRRYNTQPALLAALERLLDAPERLGHGEAPFSIRERNEARDQARAAIAAARGGG